MGTANRDSTNARSPPVSDAIFRSPACQPPQSARRQHRPGERRSRHLLGAVPRPPRRHEAQGGRLRRKASRWGEPSRRADRFNGSTFQPFYLPKRRTAATGRCAALRHGRQSAAGGGDGSGDEGGGPRPALCGHGDLRHFFDVRPVRARTDLPDCPGGAPARRASRLRARHDLPPASERRPLRGAGVHRRRRASRPPRGGRGDWPSGGRRPRGRRNPPVVRRGARPARPAARPHRPHGPRAGGDV